jgi:hypothetical protein
MFKRSNKQKFPQNFQKTSPQYKLAQAIIKSGLAILIIDCGIYGFNFSLENKIYNLSLHLTPYGIIIGLSLVLMGIYLLRAISYIENINSERNTENIPIAFSEPNIHSKSNEVKNKNEAFKNAEKLFIELFLKKK